MTPTYHAWRLTYEERPPLAEMAGPTIESEIIVLPSDGIQDALSAWENEPPGRITGYHYHVTNLDYLGECKVITGGELE